MRVSTLAGCDRAGLKLIAVGIVRHTACGNSRDLTGLSFIRLWFLTTYLKYDAVCIHHHDVLVIVYRKLDNV